MSDKHTLQGIRGEYPSMKPNNRARPSGSSGGERSGANSASKTSGLGGAKVVVLQGTCHKNTHFNEYGGDIKA